MTLLIVFNDGTERRIENVHTYEYAKGMGCFQYSLNKSTSFAYIPKEGLKYIGPEEFWVESEKLIDWDEIITCVESCRVNEFEAFSYDTARAQNYLLNLVIVNLNRMRKRKSNG